MIRYCQNCLNALPESMDFDHQGQAHCPACDALIAIDPADDQTAPNATVKVATTRSTPASTVTETATVTARETDLPTTADDQSARETQLADTKDAGQALQEQLAPRYVLESILGAGGMGSVYLATDTALDRKVAIKAVLPELGSDPQWLKRLRSEARITARLRHPAIVQVYEIIEAAGQSHIVLEYIEGTEFSNAVRRDLISLHERVRILADACRAVGHAHERGVIHRDIKPGNIMISDQHACKVMDFGIAGLDEERLEENAGNAGYGSPAFMAPEQLRGESQGDPKSDIYALGVTLYFAITARLPFRGSRGKELIERIVNEAPPGPEDLQLKRDRDLWAICEHAMSKDPEHRYGSAAEMAKDLDAWGRGDPVTVRHYPLGEQIRRAFVQRARAALVIVVITAAMFGGIYASARHVHTVAEQTILGEIEDKLLDVSYAIGTLLPVTGETQAGMSNSRLLDTPIRKMKQFTEDIRDVYMVVAGASGKFRVVYAWHDKTGSSNNPANVLKGHDSWGNSVAVDNPVASDFMRRALAGQVLVQREKDIHSVGSADWKQRLLGYAPVVTSTGQKSVLVIEMASQGVIKAFTEIEKAFQLTLFFAALLALGVLATAMFSIFREWRLKL